MKQARYTLDGSDELENSLSEICQEIGQRITEIVPKNRFQALLLGGGYGRGEGGVLKTADGDAPYNDLEFFLLIKGHPRLNEKRFGAAIHALEHQMSEKLGIEVEFKIISLEKLASSPSNMFYYDLICGHQVTAGNPEILKACAHHSDSSKIPLHEATRLLMNRCSSLLFAAERLARPVFTQEDLDFSARNIAKAQLALGDVILTTLGQYNWSCVERHRRLANIQEPTLPMAELISFHEAGVAFKLRPNPSASDHESLQNLHQAVTKAAWAVWKWQEQKRLGITIDSPIHYTSSINKCSETAAWKNALIRLRAFGVSGLLSRSRFRYPREGLLNSLAIMLWSPEHLSRHHGFLSAQLHAPISNQAEALRAYESLWHRFN